MKQLKRLQAVVGTGLVTLTMLRAGTAFAEENPFSEDNTISIKGDTSLDSGESGRSVIANLANQLLNIVLLVVGILAVFYLIYSGFQYITSAGDPAKVKTARQGIINAVIGIVIILSAFFIVRFATGLGETVTSTT